MNKKIKNKTWKINFATKSVVDLSNKNHVEWIRKWCSQFLNHRQQHKITPEQQIMNVFFAVLFLDRILQAFFFQLIAGHEKNANVWREKSNSHTQQQQQKQQHEKEATFIFTIPHFGWVPWPSFSTYAAMRLSAVRWALLRLHGTLVRLSTFLGDVVTGSITLNLSRIILRK